MSDIKLKYTEEEILAAAAQVMEQRVRYGQCFDGPQSVKDYIRFKIGASEREHFMVLFLDSQNRLIESQIMFSGSVSQTSVYPREVVKAGLQLNASGVIFAHNHPSGDVGPSQADKMLTQTLKTSCALVDIRVLDHIVVGAGGSFSFAEQGII